ncbi:MAG: hypothetical protein GAK33_01960 [Burkholderia lata]|uniref:Uncharacterized protein n=1 Tax=Burkholderia lata (strain ATCC 17760 / DSM 23089 / LMG 22485 / NCIMB 9086 / R18194 / 383) TaxID=482957 RepID=A0A833PWC3_BURL3|nr:hypothetical protein [Burkholderia lata]KAF1038624.1 MAG: hypothetical protein GAK33_01960 [Burkholderia lata]
MAVWKIAPVSDEPGVSLIQWSILEIDDGTRHFVGADARDSTGRVSSHVVTFDRLNLRGQTQSGRVYQLIGQPGWSSNAEYVWECWCEVNSVASYTDVTQQLLVRGEDDNRI